MMKTPILEEEKKSSQYRTAYYAAFSEGGLHTIATSKSNEEPTCFL